MKLLTCFTAFALVGLLAAAPTSNEEDDKVVVTKEFYIEDFVKYKAEHDIVNLLAPINSLNFEEDDSSSSESKEKDSDMIVFFVEADVQPDGSRVDQGLYVLKEGVAKKILNNGRDAAASGDDSKLVFFGAKDGLYVYNPTTNAADKYGPITDSIIAIAKEKDGDVIYILTEDRQVYKVTDNGEKKELLDDVVKANQIVVDYENNLFFYSDDKKPYVRTDDGVKKVEGLPEITGGVVLIRPPFFLDNGAPFIIDNKVYVLYPNGSSEVTDFEFTPNTMPTAFAPEAALLQYYAYDKKIYEYNVLALIVSSLLEDLGNYLNKQAVEIRSLSKNSKLKRKTQA
ncbi:jg26391 [Pararge aegeria aegeria]|uniref:Jg26391 protein n=1 Tax=Pararge aegeria aegeria TaxID=348720 RepID=A0A8S4SQ59_9NEOP|nr:jg26391 [Pararge aegeria aegeria]